MKNSALSIYIFSFVLFVAISSCKHPVEEDGISKPSFELTPQMKDKFSVTTLKRESVMEQITLTGKIEYDQNDLVTFRSLLNGIAQSVHFELGDKVKKGQVLATIQSNEVIDLTQQRNVLQNQAHFLQDQLLRKKDMLNDGLASVQEVNEVQTNLLQTQVEINKINETLSMYRAGKEKGTFYLIAPKDGFIIQKNINIGQTILTDDQPLFSVSNLNEVWVMVNVYASNLRFIKEGSSVKVRTVAYPDKIYSGIIDKIYNVFDDNEHVLKARVKLKNTDLSLLPELSADVLVDKNSKEDKTAVAIPKKAVVFDNDKRFVVIYKSDKKLEIREIKLSAENENYIYCEEGLTEGEKIISQNVLLIFEELKKTL